MRARLDLPLQLALIACACLLVAMPLGIMEGDLNPSEGAPRFGNFVHWFHLVVLLVLGLYGALSLMRAPQLAVASLPFALVTQDASSRIVQGYTLTNHPWETSVFGSNVLTRADLGAPGWYYALLLLGLGLLVVIRLRELKFRPAPSVALTSDAR